MNGQKKRFLAWCFMVANIATASYAFAADTPLYQFTMDDQTDVKCLDGSAPTIFYDNTFNTDPNLWVIAFEGSNLPTTMHGAVRGLEPTSYEDYIHICRANKSDPEGLIDDGTKGLCDSKGSGKNPANNFTHSISKGGLFDSDPTVNSFAEAQKIWVKSCTLDAWMGSGHVVADPADPSYDKNFPNLYFHGSDLVHYVFDRLRTSGLLGNRIDSPDDQVLMVGESRGSTAVFAHLDTVCDDLYTHAGVVDCRGAAFSFMPTLQKPEFDHNNQKTPIWADFLQRRYDRYQINGATHSQNCETEFQDVFNYIAPVSDRQLNPNDTSRDMCLTQFGKLKSMQRPVFIGFNRGNKGPDDLSWTAGCTNSENEYHDVGSCYNTPEYRDADIGEVLTQAQLPFGSGARVMPGSRHLFAFTKNADCVAGVDGSCWDETVTGLELINQNLGLPGSYKRALDFFWNSNFFGRQIFCANDYCE